MGGVTETMLAAMWLSGAGCGLVLGFLLGAVLALFARVKMMEAEGE